MDESDRMTEFIEKRARETLRRFALKGVKEGKLLGRHAVLGRTAPVTVRAFLDYVVGAQLLAFSSNFLVRFWRLITLVECSIHSS